ncbi:CBS domain-containing protein [Oleiagrimonas sp.]|jgi:CBS domain-containing protein|uniref:CBS domain-containing protein n=1 Tax=Oleiagrimonas sp. TaxID=2010330 RepID=UPI0026217713|nr:CBS domain-containing protein [Oleiagrimonas sp.]MDA3913147.1 CBS domain-containing protein [Oleiagrimonas sp.]
MQQVRHLLESKGNQVYRVEPETPVLDVIKQMAQHGVGALLVMRGETLVGIVSERDYARKIVLQGRSSANTPVSEIMSGSVMTIGPDSSVADCMRLCTDSRVRHLPVVEQNRVIGVVSIGDLVKAVIDEQAKEIEHLQRYIAG